MTQKLLKAKIYFLTNLLFLLQTYLFQNYQIYKSFSLTYNYTHYTIYTIFSQSLMNSARIFASRNHIIQWINRILIINMTKIQQLGSGVIYCLLLDAAYPFRIPIAKLKWYANNQVDFIHNFKILQNSFEHLGIEKKIEINKLVKSKYQDNLDFVQWFKWFLQPKIDQKKYNALKRRENRQLYLQFNEHKILKVPAESNYKSQDKYMQRRKNIQKINKKLKKTYELNDPYLQSLECKTNQSQQQNYSLQKISIKNIKNKMLKTVSNLKMNSSKLFSLDPNNNQLIQSKEQILNNKQNSYFDMNKDNMQATHNLQCMYNSPKQIKKFYFPQRFSQRLKKRIDLINGLRNHSVCKNYEGRSQFKSQFKEDETQSVSYIDLDSTINENILINQHDENTQSNILSNTNN